MKLLIVTQAVDQGDPVLGFFHRWIEVLATKFDSIEVICLKEGRHALPANVHVHSLGKEQGRPRLGAITYARRFKLLAWRLRHDYDTAFVHMNEEYVVIAGLLWRPLGKRIVLWRNFKTGSWMTPLACRLAHQVCYTSPESFTRRYANSVAMPLGIDTELFAPMGGPRAGTILFFGRFDAIKRPDIFLAALEVLEKKGVSFEANLRGDPTPGNEAYADELKRHYAHLTHVLFGPGVSNDQAPALYRAHEIYVNLTPSGSFDKTIGEAMASGCLVVCANDAMKSVLPRGALVSLTAESVASGIEAVLNLSADEKARACQAAREQVVRDHSLQLLVARLDTLLSRHEHSK